MDRRATPRSTCRPGRRGCADRRAPENARGRSLSMNLSVPRHVSRPILTKMPGHSLMLSRAAWTSRGTCRSFETHAAGALGLRAHTRRAPARQARCRDCRRRSAGSAPRSGPPRARTSAPRCSRRRSGARPVRSARGARVDLVEPAAEAREGPDVGVDGRPAQILEQVVVEMDAVQAGLAWGAPRTGTRGSRRRSGEMAPMGTCLVILALCVAVGERASRNGDNTSPLTLSDVMPGTLFVSRRQSATSKTSRCGPCGCCARWTVIAAEDTRRTARLLAHYGIQRRRSASTSTTRCASAQLLARLEAGGVRRAGHRCRHAWISDPGVELVQACREAGIRRRSDPGASAPLDRGVASGFPLTSFDDLGFPPHRSKDQKSMVR